MQQEKHEQNNRKEKKRGFCFLIVQKMWYLCTALTEAGFGSVA